MDPPDRADLQWRTAGDRIQTLLDATAAGGMAARERAEQLVGEVTDLYGAGLERMLRLAVQAEPALVDAFAADDLIASLLLVHGLHPHTVHRRVADALDTVRPYLGSHGGDVHLLGVVDDVVTLQFQGSCRSCPSSAVTLELAVEDAVRAAAPEIRSIEVVTAPTDSDAELIPAESLMSRVHRPSSWQPVPALAELAAGEVGGFRVGGTTALVCRIGDDLVAYRDRCAHCTRSMAGTHLDGSVLRCPHCGTAFDVVHAGVQVGGDLYLQPIPVLTRDGVPSMAFAEEVA